MNFEQWLRQTGKSNKTVQSYSNAITGSISEWAGSYGLTDKNLSEINESELFRRISDKLKANEDFIRRNTKGKGMYSAALNQYSNYLQDVSRDDVREDIDEILSKEIPSTEKSALVSARVGQGRYRRAVIDYWGKCALTGYKDVRLLIASHIKPWKGAEDTERVDPYNGLLLLPNIDKVFDLGFISFENDGGIIISSYLEEPDRVGVKHDMKVNLTQRHREYMAYHREQVFEKKI